MPDAVEEAVEVRASGLCRSRPFGRARPASCHIVAVFRGAAAPLQEAAVTALRFPESYYRELNALYTEKRDRFCAGLDSIGLVHNVPAGTYFVMVDISRFLELPQFRGWTDVRFCEWMAEHVGVAAVPGSSFFNEDINHLVRLHFARGNDVLDEAIARLGKLNELFK